MTAARASRRPTGPARLSALVLLGAALAGCGGLRSTVRRDEPAPEGVSSAPAAPSPAAAAEAQEREQRRELPGRIHAQVARRMPKHAPAVHRRVAGAVLTESAHAGVDPLLVLAMIHV